MKTCYVSAPFGRKVEHSTGREIDFDRIYHEVIAPAVTELGLECLRGDEVGAPGLIVKSIFNSVLRSEVMIADITAVSPNVLYELGLRHASRRGVTIIIMASGAPIPYHMTFNRVYLYELDGSGGVSGEAADKLRQTLTSVIRLSLERVTSDSPLYEFFPGMRVELPEELAGEGGRKTYPTYRQPPGSRRPRGRGLTSEQSSEEDARSVEQAVRDTPNVEPYAHVEVLKRYRDASAWGELVRYAEELPPEVSNAPEVMQLLALALNRRGQPGDQERAIGLMEKFIEDTGGDAESYGVLGRIYKDRFEEHRRAARFDEAEEALDQAIRYYRAGFEKQPSEYYPGVNVVTLLLQRGGDAARAELAEILPRVRQSLAARMQSSLAGYWELATAMELASVAGEWEEARALCERALTQSPHHWMTETTANNLRTLQKAINDPTAHEQLNNLCRRLEQAEPSVEGSNA